MSDDTIESTTKTLGTCLCGKTGVELGDHTDEIGVCHCSMCRKWSGGPFLGIEYGADIKLIGEEFVKTFSSSEWAERGFCGECGTHLFYRIKANGQVVVPVGLLDTAKKMTMDHQIFVEERPDYYSFSQKTKEMTGEEVFAYFAAQTDNS